MSDAKTIAALQRSLEAMGQIVHNMTVAQQAAWLEWQTGNGAEAAMDWIENGLIGPGLLPEDEDGKPVGLTAQAFFDQNADEELKGKRLGGTLTPKGWRGALLWSLYHHQGASSPVGQPIRALLGIGVYDKMTGAQIEEAKAFGAQPDLFAAINPSGGTAP